MSCAILKTSIPAATVRSTSALLRASAAPVRRIASSRSIVRPGSTKPPLNKNRALVQGNATRGCEVSPPSAYLRSASSAATLASSSRQHDEPKPWELRPISDAMELESDAVEADWLSYYTSRMPLPKYSPAPQILSPHVYNPRAFGWAPCKALPGQGALPRNKILKLVSWNIDSASPSRANRAAAAMSHLQAVFGETVSSPMIVMLQEVHPHSLNAILAQPWVRNNFSVSNVDAPEHYSTVLMASRQLQPETWFRVPFLESQMDRDVLAVDIPIQQEQGDSKSPKQTIRICTSHLGPLWNADGEKLRRRQLAQISALLKSPPAHAAEVVAGVLGGDLSSVSPTEAFGHKAKDVAMRDAWEDAPAPLGAPRAKFQPDLTFGRATGDTFGHQSYSPKPHRRLDKFLYTGFVETVPLNEAQDMSGKVGRLGINIKTKTYPIAKDGGVRKEVEAWVSDHFAITLGVKVI